MADLESVRQSLAPTLDELAKAGVSTHAIPAVNPPRPRVPKVNDDTLDEMRNLFGRRAYTLLQKPAVWARLEAHLLHEDARLSLKAFEVLIGSLLAHTKPEKHVSGPVVPIVIENHIPAPPGSPVIETNAV